MNIPKEFQLKCKGCGEILDMRDASVLAHGWIENGKIVCYTDKKLNYSISKEIGTSILWTKHKKPIGLS